MVRNMNQSAQSEKLLLRAVAGGGKRLMVWKVNGVDLIGKCVAQV